MVARSTRHSLAISLIVSLGAAVCDSAWAQCNGLGSINFTVVAAPEPTLDFPTGICNGQQATLVVNEPFDGYLWSTGGTANSINVSQGGTYTVTVTNSAGCEGTASAVVIANPAPTPAITGNTTICPGGSTVLSLTQNYPDILWSGGQTTQDITVSSLGTYTVTVTDANGCTASNSIVVTPGSSFFPPFTALPSGCGQFALEVGPGYASYLWSTGSTSQSILVTQTGDYSVTVTDASSCTGTVSLTVVIPPPAVVQINGAQSICSGGTATLTASSGFVNYSWSNGVNSATNVVNQPGAYSVTATDASGCTATATVNVNALPDPVPLLSLPAPICSGETATISVTNPNFQNYNWSNGGTGSSIPVSTAGTYTVTVTDAAGCTGTDVSSLTINPSPSIAVSQLPYQCNGLAQLSATPGFPTYVWSNGESIPNITVDQAGTYTVTVTGANGCTNTANVIADIPPDPQVVITGDADICDGTNTTLLATSGFSNYLWNTGQGGSSISVNASGTYFVTVTNAFSCTATNSFNVTVQPVPEPQITGPTQICAGGTAVFTATGGPFASYLWSNGSQTSSISVSNAGSYGLTVTAANGCTGTASVGLTVGNSLAISLIALPYQCNGQIVLDAGAGFQTYSWSTGGNQQLETVSSNGSFTVTVTDATGCTGEATTFVTIPAPPQATISGPNQICEGESAALTATAGFANYLWSNGQQNPGISATTSGTYAVTLTDFDGCQTTASFSLTVNLNPEPVITGSSTICQNSSTVLSATGTYQDWSWSSGQTTPEITVSAAGDYAVTVTGANGCTGTDVFQLNVSTSLQPQITAQPYTCNGQLTLDAGVGFLTYTWSNGGASQTIPVTQNGNYEVTVSDASGCTGTAVFNANIPTQPIVAITGTPPFCAGGSSVLTAAAGFQSYLWSDGTLFAETTVTLPGTYTVTATDANGCTSVASLAVVENTLPQPQILGGTTLCNGASTTLSVSTNFPTLLWSTGETTPQISVSSAGTIGLQVTDANGCSGSTSVEVISGSLPSPQITAQPYTCNGQLTLDAGAGFLTYTWSNGGASQTIPITQNGNYEVTVSDASGCTGTAVFNANIPAQPIVAITGTPAFCAGGSSVLTAAAGFQSYLWSDGTLFAETTVTLPGTYTVTATDANGCTSVAALAVVENTLPQPQILGVTTLCNGSSTTLSVGSNFPTLLWSTGETTPQITVSSAGTIGLQVTDANGCSGSASVEVIAGSLASPQITTQPYTCNGQLTLDAGAGFLSYTWSNGGASQTIPITQNGNYTVTVSDVNGCTATGSLLAQVPPVLSVSISGNSALCPGDTAQLSVPPSFDNYVWSTGQTSNGIAITASGNYSVTVTDQFGCTAVDGLALDFAEAPYFEIIGDQLDCASAEAALGLDLLDVNGSPSILWSNGVTTATLVTTQPGVYSVTVTDANGCSEIQTTEVLQQSIYASFADTLEFVPGQIVPLIPPAVGFQPVEIMWSPTDILVDCSNCPTAQARPTEDVLVRFKAVSEAGCVQEGTYFLFSKEKLRPAVYAPNAISPDSPLNPGFTLFGNELLVEIKYLRVFTRWGELVEELENIAPNNPSIGWNGSFRGQPVTPGVFVWVAEVVYQDGSTEVMQGDITVIR